MSGLLSMRRAAPPRHSLRTSRPRTPRLDFRRAGDVAKSAGLVLVAALVLLSAVFLVLAVTSWASDRQPPPSAGTGF